MTKCFLYLMMVNRHQCKQLRRGSLCVCNDFTFLCPFSISTQYKHCWWESDECPGVQPGHIALDYTHWENNDGINSHGRKNCNGRIGSCKHWTPDENWSFGHCNASGDVEFSAMPPIPLLRAYCCSTASLKFRCNKQRHSPNYDSVDPDSAQRTENHHHQRLSHINILTKSTSSANRNRSRR